MSDALALNIFRQEAFSAISLSAFVDRHPYLPSFLGSLDIFEEEPIMTTSLMVAQAQGVLNLIPTTPRGAPIVEQITQHRQARTFACPRLAIGDTISASEVQNITSWNDGTSLETMEDLVQRKLTGPDGLTSKMEYTWENHRLGAIRGNLLDANGAVIYNFFQEFGITPPAEIVLNLLEGVGGPPNSVVSGYLLSQFNGIKRQMARAGQGAFGPQTEVHALCGDAFFDALVNHPDIKQAYANTMNALGFFNENRAFGTFYFGGIFWHNYRGSDDNSTIAVPTNKAFFFPRKAPGVFKVALAPGESIGFVNRPGRKMYVLPIEDRDRQMWQRFELYSYPLHICTRPEMLLTATMDTTAD